MGSTKNENTADKMLLIIDSIQFNSINNNDD